MFIFRLIVHFLSQLLVVMPRRVSLFLGDMIGALWFDVLRIRRKVVMDNLNLAYPALGESEKVRIARQSLYGMGRTIIEYLLLVKFKKGWVETHFEFKNTHYIDEALKEGKGVFILTAHLGNGDFSCVGLTQKGYPMNLISKQFKSEWLNEAWFGLRRRLGVKIIFHEKSTFDILKAVKRNEIVAFVLDQFMGPPVGVKTKFFGVETGTAQGLAIFARKTGAPVIPVFNYRLSDGRFCVFCEPRVEFEEKSTVDETISFMTQKYTDRIEAAVKNNPGQWMWLHRRWKKFEVR